MTDPRDEVLQLDYWELWTRFADIANGVYSYEDLDALRVTVRDHGMKKIRKRRGRKGREFCDVWSGAITLSDEADLDVVATHLTDPNRPADAEP